MLKLAEAEDRDNLIGTDVLGLAWKDKMQAWTLEDVKVDTMHEMVARSIAPLKLCSRGKRKPKSTRMMRMISFWKRCRFAVLKVATGTEF